MSKQTAKTIELLEMLPEEDQLFAFEFIKKLVLAWNPDYSKLTTAERIVIDGAKKDEYSMTHDDLKKELGLDKEKD